MAKIKPLIRKIYKTARGQLLVSIPSKEGFDGGDYVKVEKVKA